MTLLRTQLGNTLRGHRLRQRRTLRDVSGAARVSLGYLSEVERGQKEASSELLASICDALDVELADLLAEVSLEMRLAEPARRPVRPVALAGVGAGRPRCPRRRPGRGRGVRDRRAAGHRGPRRRARPGAGRRRPAGPLRCPGDRRRLPRRLTKDPLAPHASLRSAWGPARGPFQYVTVGRVLLARRHEHRSASTCLTQCDHQGTKCPCLPPDPAPS
ncbi:protein of unknown function [Modestobacter italicus]|uniref:HTH cro/C1-type domain-containing protein n=1 Tax=Modestobacter italicus (strain DSM 44449 / CECT 9708 / BC 501) TaxID=2732864 RepID=I4F261_MODI5|nr:helix-turn-helix transcriptional regulator [Modestobacter marinus]CCH89724.1 protein of unknown function [Modestobacter marinus]